MDITVTLQHIDSVGQLTTNHAASSYGQPVLVVDGAAYGQADSIDGKPLAIWPQSAPYSGEVTNIFATLMDNHHHVRREAELLAVAAWNSAVDQAWS